MVWVNSFLVLDGLKKKSKVTFFGDTFLMRARLGKGSKYPSKIEK